MIGNIVAGICSPEGLLVYKDEVLFDSPIGFWLLDEASGTTMTDYSTSAINGTYYNNPSLDQAGNSGGILKSVFFNSASSMNAYTATSSTFNLAPSSNWSIEVWYKDNNTTNSTIETLVSIRGNDGLSTDTLGNIAINNGAAGKIQGFTTSSVPANLILTYDLTPDTNWHQVVLTAVSSGALKLYVDSVERASTTTARYSTTTNKRAVVGSNWNATVGFQYSTANIAAVSVYNTTLSQSQINNHYNAGK
jgi:hypothetical protein